MSNQDLKKTVEEWKTTVDTNAFSDSVAVFAEASVSPTKLVDKISTWAAAGTAAVAGLAITNIDKMASVYSMHQIKIMFSCLALSMAFAVLQKMLATLCQSMIEVTNAVKRNFPDVINTFSKSETEIKEMSDKHSLGVEAKFNLDEVIQRYAELHPWFLVKLLKKSLEKSKKDRNYSHKILIHRFFNQTTSAATQYIFILIFIGCAAFFI